MSRRPSLIAAARAGAAQTAARLHLLAFFLVLNLLAGWVLAAPVRGLLSAELDANLYGEVMRTGASWRWFHTVGRQHPEAVGDFTAFTAVVSDEGVRWKDLRQLSGTAAAVALAGLFLFWLNGVLHCAFLDSLREGRSPEGFGAAAVRFAPPLSALAFFALLTYALVYALFYVQTGKWLEDAREAVDSEWLAMGMTWARLALTLAGLLMVKVLYDLAKVVLVERGGWNWPWAFLLALKEVLRRGGRYLLLYLLIGVGTPLLAGLWWLTGGRLTASGWVLLVLLFLLHQLFLAARIGLRLTHLAAARALYHDILARQRSARPPYKVEAPSEHSAGAGRGLGRPPSGP